MRYRILYGLDGATAQPIGVAVEREDHVEVLTPWDYGIASEQRDEYTVMGPDLQLIRYEPGDPEYFDRIVEDLHRSFAIGPEITTEEPDERRHEREAFVQSISDDSKRGLE